MVKENKVASLLTRKSCLNLTSSPFLKLLFNRLQATRQSLYDSDLRQQPGLTSVIQE